MITDPAYASWSDQNKTREAVGVYRDRTSGAITALM